MLNDMLESGLLCVATDQLLLAIEMRRRMKWKKCQMIICFEKHSGPFLLFEISSAFHELYTKIAQNYYTLRIEIVFIPKCCSTSKR